MNKINRMKAKFLSRRFLGSDNAILVYLAILKLVIHLLTGSGYGYYGDELYYLDATRHLDFGYVDMPPLITLLMAISNQIMGLSLLGLHVFPAVAGAVMVCFAGLLARELGGGRFAQGLTALMVIASPIWLILDSWFAYDPFDQLFTVIFLYLAVRLLKRETPRLWILFGIIAGAGMMIKLSMLFTGFAFAAALLLTSRRKWFATQWPWIAALIAGVLCSPFIIWQSAHGWPLFIYWRHYALYRPHQEPLLSFIEQIFYLNPITLPIWLLGLYYLLFHREGKQYRLLGLMYLILQVLFGGIMRFESRLSASAYFPLLAAGAIFVEKLIAALAMRRIGWNRLKPACAGMIILSGLLLVPIALPVLSISSMEKYVQSIGSPIPFQFSFRLGWPEMVKQIAAVYRGLPETDRRKCAIYASTYAEAGAIDLFGKAYGLPGAISNHLSYHIWGLGKYSGEVVIAFGSRFTPGILPAVFHEVTKVATIGNQYGIGIEQDLPVYVCRRPKADFKEIWKRLEDFK